MHLLVRTAPELSAAMPAARWQRIAGALAAGALALGLVVAPRLALEVIIVLAGLTFLFVALLRILAMRELVSGPAVRKLGTGDRPRDEVLPVYSVLIPLYREERVAAQLVRVMSRLDYPPDRLDILLITEADDEATARALAAIDLPAHFRVVDVPAGEPRTKPRALNYGLSAARGDYVVVYDAEDVPEPDQLRRALAMLAAAPGRLGCVQARLNVYNRDDGFLARQFTIEYTAQFDAIIAALARLDLPVPLGGTSNHFPRAVLEAAGGWDPYNVTEDADLGLRLARRGLAVGILDSTTWEEAPRTWPVWRRQRTRWLKGWMQTWLVHMRHPRRLMRELGMRRFAGLQVLFAAMILSALLHPVFYVIVALDFYHGTLLQQPADPVDAAIWWLGYGNFALGYLTAGALAYAAVARRGWRRLALHVVVLPIYWLAISEAAYRALGQLARRPFYWEKTDHSGCAPAELTG